VATVDKSEDPLVMNAVTVARRVAADFDRVFFLHCPDAETHRVVMPDQPDHGLQCRLDTAFAAELVANGVELAVQVVDRAAYISWLAGHQSNSEWRAAYRDPGRLMRGEAALELLGVPPSAVRPRPRRPASRQRKGTPADRLVRAWLDDDPEFDTMLGVLLDDGRQGVLDVAIRKVAADYADEEVEDFKLALLDVAEAAEVERGTWAILFVVAVIVDPQIATLPEPMPIAEGIKASGHFVTGRDVLIVPAWFDPDAIISMTASALRKTLRDIIGGGTPSGPRPLAKPPSHGTLVMLGVTVDDYPKSWEDAVEAVEEKDDDQSRDHDVSSPVLERLDAAFENWSDGLLASNPALIDVRLPIVASQLANDLEFAAEQFDVDGDAATPTSSDELRDFVEIAAGEAGEEGLVCIPRVVSNRVELSLYTTSGRLVDTRDFGDAELGAAPASMLAAVAAIVPISDQPPGSG
jgi:hypothetical protein